MVKTRPSFNEERLLWEKGYSLVAGIDEVGRGAFAGPLVTAAVIFPQNCQFSDPALHEINDSKLLSEKKRKSLSEKIKQTALSFNITEIPLHYINRFGIGKAAQLGFYKTVRALSIQPEFCLIDAFWITRMSKKMQKPIIHGDALSYSIAAASIIAKVYRDELMVTLHNYASVYNFAENKGYGTGFHRSQLAKHGLSPFHRKSFALGKFLTNN